MPDPENDPSANKPGGPDPQANQVRGSGTLEVPDSTVPADEKLSALPPEAPPADAAAAQATPAWSSSEQRATEEFEELEPLTPEIVEEEAIRGDFVLRWAVVLLAFLLGSTRIAETQTLVHIKTGQYLAKNGVLPPANDVFSYTATERPWTNLSWGFDLLLAGLHGLGQFVSLSVGKALVIAVAFWLIGRISRPGTPTWWGSVCGVLALLGCHLRMSAQPTLVTMLGLSVVMFIVLQARQSSARPQKLWWLVGVFVIWSNLDPRAWLGLAFLLLYVTGDSLGAWLQSPNVLGPALRKQLWQVTGASIAATLVHPFWWKSLAAPWLAYSVEYPAIRDYLQETVLASGKAPALSMLMFFPMTTEAFWLHLNIGSIAALAIIVLALVAIFLNLRQLDWGQVLAYVGFTLLAVVCLYELPAAAIVAGVVAALNGQEWYAARCRQTYSVETGELLFSRGGRALTVISFAAIGFFGGTGRLRDASQGRPGYGLDYNLDVRLGDLKKQIAGDASFDHHPFNTLLSQGDQLIWLGEQVFADSRVGVYYSANEDDNVLSQQLITRDALTMRRDIDSQKPAEGGKSLIWRKTFDKYKLTHVVLRLETPRDYEILSEILQDTLKWEWTSLGATSAVFYRRNAKLENDADYKKFVADHKIDFRKRAFVDAERLTLGRDRQIRPPSVYKKYFWSTKIEEPPEIHEAVQLVQLARYPGLPRHLDASRGAMAHLAIRLAQMGLSKDPDAVTGYLALGGAYDYLSRWEYFNSQGARQPRNGVRYLQAVAAYNQALIGDPLNLAAHTALLGLYQEARRPDLMLQHLQVIDQEMTAHPEGYSDDDMLSIGKQIAQLEKSLKTTESEIIQRATSPGKEPNPLAMAQGWLQQGCVLRALTQFERDLSQVAGNPQFDQLRVTLLLEAGRVDEAYELAGQFILRAQKAGDADWGDIMSIVCLPQGDYEGATQRWLLVASDTERRALQKLILTLPPRVVDPSAPWPLSTTRTATEYFFQNPEAVAGKKLEMALAFLENGEIKLSEQYFREALATYPNTLNRPLIGYYLNELTDGKENTDMVPPSDRITESFAPEPGDE